MTYGLWDHRDQGHRIHIFGPSGAGTSTLGRVLACKLASQHFDTDDFYWHPTDPPFIEKRPVRDRWTLMEDMFLPRRDWVLSGSMDGWAGSVVHRFTFAVRLTLDPAIRRMRLEQREAVRCNCKRDWGQLPCERCTAFLAWADGYEAGLRPGRSLQRHLDWAPTLPCPVMVLDAGPPVKELVAAILSRLDHSATLA